MLHLAAKAGIVHIVRLLLDYEGDFTLKVSPIYIRSMMHFLDRMTGIKHLMTLLVFMAIMSVLNYSEHCTGQERRIF